MVGLAVAYFAAARTGLLLASLHPSATAVWPPTGIAIAAFLVWGNRVWPAVLLGAFSANLATHGTPLACAIIGLGNTAEGFTGAWLVRRFARGRLVFERPLDTFRFVGLAALLATMVSATTGVTVLCTLGDAKWAQYGPIWITWWLGDAIGALIVAPSIVLWSTRSGIEALRRRWVEASLLLLSVLALSLVLFLGFTPIFRPHSPTTFLCVPMLIWAAFRFGPRETATVSLVFSALAVWGTVRGTGPFVLPTQNASLLLLQSFMATLNVTALALAALVAEHVRVNRDLRRAQVELEERVRLRTADLSFAVDTLHDEVLEHERTVAKLREKERDLASAMAVQREAQFERERLEQELARVSDHEQQRIGEDLHDDLGQLLAGVALMSRALERRLADTSPAESKMLGEIHTFVQDAIDKTRRLARGLAPVGIEPDGLRAALEDLVRANRRLSDLEIVFTCDAAVQIDNHITATHLYRIAQEAIRNSVRHAKSRRVDVTLATHDGQVTLCIEDDGSGFEHTRDAEHGLGLRIMRHRAHLIEAQLEIRSDDRGTTVRCAVRQEAASPGRGV
jgi:signal transduction histidine kinase